MPRVHQEDPEKLKGTVTQAAKDRTITGTATVTPSGDMARKHPWDRNSGTIAEYSLNSAGNHAWTVRWTYTVPANHNAIHSVLMEYMSRALTAGKLARVKHEVSIDDGSNYYIFARFDKDDSHPVAISQTLTATFSLVAGEIIRASSFTDNVDTVTFQITSLLTEFDE